MKKISRISEGQSIQGSLLGYYYHDFRYELSIPGTWMQWYFIKKIGYGDPIVQSNQPIFIIAYSFERLLEGIGKLHH